MKRKKVLRWKRAPRSTRALVTKLTSQDQRIRPMIQYSEDEASMESRSVNGDWNVLASGPKKRRRPGKKIRRGRTTTWRMVRWRAWTVFSQLKPCQRPTVARAGASIIIEMPRV